MFAFKWYRYISSIYIIARLNCCATNLLKFFRQTATNFLHQGNWQSFSFSRNSSPSCKARVHYSVHRPLCWTTCIHYEQYGRRYIAAVQISLDWLQRKDRNCRQPQAERPNKKSSEDQLVWQCISASINVCSAATIWTIIWRQWR